jgi:hypothetical protein
MRKSRMQQNRDDEFCSALNTGQFVKLSSGKSSSFGLALIHTQRVKPKRPMGKKTIHNPP